MNEIENDLVKFYKVDGILYNEYKKSGFIDGEAAKKIIEMRHLISNGESQYWCMDAKGIKSYNKEARDISDEYGQDFLFACAALVDSHLTKFMFNAFLKLKVPKIPFQVFTDKDKAIKWLLEIKAKNEGN